MRAGRLAALFAFAVLGACGGPAPGGVAVTGAPPTTTPPPTATTAPDISKPWSALGAQGHLLFVQHEQGVSSLDLGTSKVESLYAPPDPTAEWVNAAAISPDGATAVLAYAPPARVGEFQYGYTGLYLLPADGSAAPQPFLLPSSGEESYFQPSWSPDGEWIYYAHLVHFTIPNTSPQQYGFKYTIERVAYPGGEIQPLADAGFWPRPSPDGARLAYVSLDVETGTTQLVVCSADGSDPQVIPTPAEFQTIDAPLFTADGQAVLLSVVTQGLGDAGSRPALSWLERLLGIEVAEAHNVPSDWWLVPLDGSPATQITHLLDIGLYASLSPDRALLAYGSQTGLFLGRPDLTRLVQVRGIQGVLTVDWGP